MKLNCYSHKTKKIKNYLKLLEIAKKAINELVSSSPQVAEKLCREVLLKSGLHSARLTGNKVPLEDTREMLEGCLLPRRKEILRIIKDHQMVSFDFIKRRFISVPESTLHYDLRQLIKQGFIKKLGSTRGTNYTPK